MYRAGGMSEDMDDIIDLQNGGDEQLSEDEARKRREQLNRRPSYRMILKDLETADKTMKKEPDESPPPSVVTSRSSLSSGDPGSVPPLQQQGSAPLHVQIPGRAGGAGASSASLLDGSPYSSPLGGSIMLQQGGLHHLNGSDLGGLASLDYGNRSQVAAAAALVAASRGQVTPTSTGGPSSVSSDMHGLKGLNDLSGSGSFTNDWNSMLGSHTGYSSSPSPTMGGPSMHGGHEDESTRKRQKLQVRLLKNREAAKECRRKKKEYVKCLENRVAVLETQNKALIEELKNLKELYCRKEKTEM